MRKFLFLDIDGVLVTGDILKDYLPDGHHDFNKESIGCLNKIVGLTNCDVVISSSWRIGLTLEEFKRLFEVRGFLYCDKIIGLTPRLHMSGNERYSSVPRGSEIRQWLMNNFVDNGNGYKKIGVDYNYLILDDDDDMLYEQRNNYIQTSFYGGLMAHHVELAVKILNWHK
jgi:hypothetical protein